MRGQMMSEHYYSQKPTTGHNRHKLQVDLRGRTFTFVTDAGVFSKQGIDYGSRFLIEEMIIPADARVLDVGCGYGPIGIAAATLAVSGHVTMIDINERAIELARENARLNRVDHVDIVQSDLFTAVADREFDRILTNPPIRAGKEVVHHIFEEACKRLSPGGELWVVIQKKQGAPSALAKLETLFPEVLEVGKDKGYRIYRSIK